MASPMRTGVQRKSEFQKKADETYKNLRACWEVDLKWSNYPEVIEKVSQECDMVLCNDLALYI